MITSLGKLTIVRSRRMPADVTLTGLEFADEDWISIEIYDVARKKTVVTVTVDLKEFAMAITGMARQPCMI
jgi:hypothetical protein